MSIPVEPRRWPRRVILVAVGGASFVGTGQELQEQGIDLQVFPDVAVALVAVGEDQPDAIVVPAVRGVSLAEICRAVTGWTSTAVIVAFPADGDPSEAYAALDNGATSLLPLPANTAQLSGALANLGFGTSDPVTVRGRLWLDPVERRFGCGDRSVHPSLQEFRVLERLMAAAPSVVDVSDLVIALGHGDHTAEAVGNLRAVIRRIRRRIQPLFVTDAEDVLRTVRRSGYLMSSAAVQPLASPTRE